MLEQVLAQVREGEVDIAAPDRLDQLGCDEAKPILAGIVDVDTQAPLDVGHLRRSVVLRHRQQEGAVNGGGVGQGGLVDE